MNDQHQYRAQIAPRRQESQEIGRAKSSLLSMMSHEFITPLTGILGFAELLETTVSESNREFVGLIHESGVRLLQTLRSVLQFVQIQTGQAVLNIAPVDVLPEIARVLKQHSPAISEAGLTVALELSRPTYAMVDRDAFSHVIVQLLSNAIKFTCEGTITICARTLEDAVEIAVSDTGIGISEEFLPHVFDEFKQESTGESREFEGCGIGLTIVKALLERMDGTVVVSSEKGAGSTFTLRLNRPSDGEAAALAYSATRYTSSWSRSAFDRGDGAGSVAPTFHDTDITPNILTREYVDERTVRPETVMLIDDDRRFIDRLRPFVERCGASVVGTAYSAEEALERIGPLQPSVVLLDICMLGKSGVEAIRPLLEQSPSSRIVIVSSMAAEYGEKAMELGACGYVEKHKIVEELPAFLAAAS